MSFLIQTVAGDLDWITRSGEPGSAIGFPIARVLLVAAVAAGAALIVVVAIHLDRAGTVLASGPSPVVSIFTVSSNGSSGFSPGPAVFDHPAACC